jgi:LPXTG-motif cell wall-anchored protein
MLFNILYDTIGQFLVTNSKGTYYHFPTWENNNRADTIYDEHFKDGDVLIYYNDDTNTKDNLKFTKEQGIYAYIYLDGKFVGQNQTGDAVRNEYTYQYYTEKTDIGKDNLADMNLNNDDLVFANYQTLFGKDYYVILRPEKIIQSNNVDIVVPDTGKNTSIIFTIVGGLIIVIGSLVLITKRRRVN